jgi:tRNA(Arg) A34 adenosine deaminase TadA
MWDSLSPPWQASLEEAWAAYCAGCVPIGAVITDAAGHILARGRNHILDDGDAPVKRHELAHAELNALLSLRYTGDHHDPHTWALYTSMEPCPLCLGAFYMSGIRQLHYAARDAWAGSVNLLGTTPYLSRKPIRVTGPSSDLETVSVALNVEYFLNDSVERAQVLFDVWRQVVPRGVALGERLYETGALRKLRAAEATAEEMIQRLAQEARLD